MPSLDQRRPLCRIVQLPPVRDLTSTPLTSEAKQKRLEWAFDRIDNFEKRNPRYDNIWRERAHIWEFSTTLRLESLVPSWVPEGGFLDIDIYFTGNGCYEFGPVFVRRAGDASSPLSLYFDPARRIERLPVDEFVLNHEVFQYDLNPLASVLPLLIHNFESFLGFIGSTDADIERYRRILNDQIRRLRSAFLDEVKTHMPLRVEQLVENDGDYLMDYLLEGNDAIEALGYHDETDSSRRNASDLKMYITNCLGYGEISSLGLRRIMMLRFKTSRKLFKLRMSRTSLMKMI